MTSKKKVIFHIDVDSFFVSVETSLRPELIDKDIAISLNKPKAVVCALSYSAKKKGAKVPMKLYEVKKYCPDIIVIKPNHSLYEQISRNIFDFLKNKYSKYIEYGSIDEWYLDVTHFSNKYLNPIDLAQNIQKDIKNIFSSNVTIGISYNKFLAKIATELNKPSGITLIRKKDIPKKIWPLDIDKYIGIGKTLSSEFKKNGINTIGDLANITSKQEGKIRLLLKNQFNKYIENAKGIVNESNIEFNNYYNERESIGVQSTYGSKYLIELFEIYEVLKKLSNKLSDILIRRNLSATGIMISIKTPNKKLFTSSLKLNKSIYKEKQIFEESKKLFVSLWNETEILMLGISVYDLYSNYLVNKNLSLDLENSNEINNINNIVNIINSINKKIGKNNLKLLSDNKNGDKHG